MTDSPSWRMARSLFFSQPVFVAEGVRSAPEQKSPLAPVSSTQRASDAEIFAKGVADRQPHVHGAGVARANKVEGDGHHVIRALDPDVLVADHGCLAPFAGLP